MYMSSNCTWHDRGWARLLPIQLVHPLSLAKAVLRYSVKGRLVDPSLHRDLHGARWHQKAVLLPMRIAETLVNYHSLAGSGSGGASDGSTGSPIAAKRPALASMAAAAASPPSPEQDR
eukprot:COSAG02_NODE_4291_length_5541_cov_2.094267_5_plen_118_part_00